MFVCKERGNIHWNQGSSGVVPHWYPWDLGTSIDYDVCYGGVCYDEARMLSHYDYGYDHAIQYPYSSQLLGYERFCSTDYGSRRLHSVNECDHRRNIVRNLPYAAIVARTGQQYGGANVWRYRREPIPVQELAPDVLRHPPLDLRAAQTTAWYTMQPRFEGEVSLINSIFELKDFKDIAGALAKHPLDRLSQLFKAVKRGKRGVPPSGVDSLNSAANVIAEARLMNEFAIKPLVSDILTIGKELRQMVDEAQKQFALDGESGNTRYYSEDFVHSQNVSWYYTQGYAFGSGSVSQTRFTACLSYSYKYNVRGIQDAAAQYFGLNWTAEAIWNAMPFSFLADYFINIGETLRLMRLDPNVYLTYSVYTESLLTEISEGYILDPSNGFHCGVPVIVDRRKITRPTLISGGSSTLYTRSIRDPNFGPVAPRFKLPSTGQWMNVAALMKTLLF